MDYLRNIIEYTIKFEWLDQKVGLAVVGTCVTYFVIAGLCEVHKLINRVNVPALPLPAGPDEFARSGSVDSSQRSSRSRSRQL